MYIIKKLVYLYQIKRKTLKIMNYLSETLSKIENAISLKELSNIRFAINYPSFGWSESDKIVLNSRINDAESIVGLTIK